MKFESCEVEGAYIITQEPFADERGSFARSFCEREFIENGLDITFVQSNICYNKSKGILRGLHTQRAAYAEDKLVCCIQGGIYDVCVDVRPDSPTYLRHIAIELTEENGKMLFIPKGCAHGYLTLSDKSRLVYYMSTFYVPNQGTGYRYDDPAFSIVWPLNEPYIMSVQDRLWSNIDGRKVKNG